MLFVMLLIIGLLISVLVKYFQFEMQKKNIAIGQKYIRRGSDPFDNDNYVVIENIKKDYVLYGNNMFNGVTATKNDFLTRYELY